MIKYAVVISEQARYDLNNLSEIIIYQYKAPVTAEKYLQGIYAEIAKLSHSAESYPVQTRKSLQQYGPYPRLINYKRMAIIYNAIGSTVIIRRIIPANTISGLGTF